MLYILSCIIDKFFFLTSILAVDQHLDFALFRPDHHRLVAHATDHVKRVPRFAPKCQLKGVFLDAFFQRLFQGALNLKKSVGRTQTSNALMGPLVVVILDPKSDSLAGLFIAAKLRPLQKLGQNRLPEPFDLAQRHGMMGAGFDVLDPIFLQCLFKPSRPSPVGILAAVVREHLLGHAVFADRLAIGL